MDADADADAAPTSRAHVDAAPTSRAHVDLVGHLNSGFEAQYGQKLELIEKIRHELKGEGIKAPGIIVIGAQSAGKSSILTRLTGISFPTGDGTCTRSPAVVSVKTDTSVNGFLAIVADNASFDQAIHCHSISELHVAIKDFTSALTDRATKPITDAPIFIQHTRPRGPAMTLIDLPGITHVAQENAEFDIHAITSGLVYKYMKDDNVIALVVLNANDDFSNSEALEIARKCDPTGERTIGVVAKCDLVPTSGTDILQKLRMARSGDVKLKLGFIAVRNRSESDTGDVDAEEAKFFSSHPILQQLSTDSRGIRALSKKVIQLQGRSVDRFFSDLKSKLYDRNRSLKDDLAGMKEVPQSDEDRRGILTNILRAIHDRMDHLLRTDDVRNRQLNIPTRTLEFCEKFSDNVCEEMPSILSEGYMRKIEVNFKETRGRVLPDVTVDTIIHQVIDEMLLDTVLPSKTEQLIEQHESLIVTVYETIINERTDCSRFPRLASFLFTATKDYLLRAKQKALSITKELIDAERVGSFTLNALYLEMTQEMQSLVLAMSSQHITQGGRMGTTSGIIMDDEEDGSVYPQRRGTSGSQGNGRDNGNKRGNDVGARETEVSGASVPLLQILPRVMWQSNVGQEEFGLFIKRYAAASVQRKPNPELLRLQFSVHCYAHIVMKRLFDLIPMVVRNNVVHEVHRGYHQYIETALTDNIEELRRAMAEDPEEHERRKTLAKRIETLGSVYEQVMST